MTSLNSKKQIQVSVGIIKNQKTRDVFLAWRDAEKHQGDCYEFPGGKVDAGETPRDALERELLEEVGIKVSTSKKLTELSYDYPEKTVLLHVFLVTDFLGEPHGAEGQKVQWVSVDTLSTLSFPAANVPLVRMARLESTYVITHDINEFVLSDKDTDISLAIDRWLTFYAENLPKRAQCYVRVKSLDEVNYVELVQRLHECRSDLQLIAMGRYQSHDVLTHMAVGFHLTQQELMVCDQIQRKNKDSWIIAACHDEASISKANALGVDAITISPVNPTQTHPHASALGWDTFFELAKGANTPVYALGGMSYDDNERILSTDVFGLAGIRHFL